MKVITFVTVRGGSGKTVRFNEACRLLHEKKHSIAEISDMVGFATPSYFAAAFKRFIDCTPSEYLKKKH